jgi:hypothetical protein
MRIGGGGVPDSTAFSQQLAELKREGSNILVVGQEADRAHSGACRHLLGHDGAERRRVFVFTQGQSVCSCAPDAVDGEREIVRHDHGEADGEDALSVLGSDVVRAIDVLEPVDDELEPAELRLCFDSLGPLFVGHESEHLFRLLHVVTSRVRQVDGMGHFHLRVDRDSDHVNLLEPLFDAVVEVREDGETSEQRWHLRNSNVSSDWLGI